LFTHGSFISKTSIKYNVHPLLLANLPLTAKKMMKKVKMSSKIVKTTTKAMTMKNVRKVKRRTPSNPTQMRNNRSTLAIRDFRALRTLTLIVTIAILRELCVTSTFAKNRNSNAEMRMGRKELPITTNIVHLKAISTSLELSRMILAFRRSTANRCLEQLQARMTSEPIMTAIRTSETHQLQP